MIVLDSNVVSELMKGHPEPLQHGSQRWKTAASRNDMATMHYLDGMNGYSSSTRHRADESPTDLARVRRSDPAVPAPGR